MKQQRFFASDNCSPVHPHIMEALHNADAGKHAISYGNDAYTEDATALFQDMFGQNSSSFFVFNGTAANVLAIKSLLKTYESVIAPEIAHLSEDECGSLESIAGMKIETIPHTRGKISSQDIPACLAGRGTVHRVQPRLLSVTQSNELGQCYSIEEMQDIGRVCREHELYFHVDGARIANAVAFLLMDSEPGWAELSPKALKQRGREILAAISVDAGVHALSLGGTKNGLMFGEAIITMNSSTMNPAAKSTDLAFYQKQAAQLASKMRYISTQFRTLYKDELWLSNALHANEMARYLAEGIHRVAQQCNEANRPAVLYPVQANAVFIKLPPNCAQTLQPVYRFYAWGEEAYRFMCSWDTTTGDIDRFLDSFCALSGC